MSEIRNVVEGDFRWLMRFRLTVEAERPAPQVPDSVRCLQTTKLATLETEPRLRSHGSNSLMSLHAGKVRNMLHWVTFTLIHVVPIVRVLRIGLTFNYGHLGSVIMWVVFYCSNLEPQVRHQACTCSARITPCFSAGSTLIRSSALTRFDYQRATLVIGSEFYSR